jgi:PIN domain nuclease of toxin-antitoxin system
VTYALDASAMIAYLKRETGWNVVAGLLADPTNRCHAHAVNLCEVYIRIARAEGRPKAEAAIKDLLSVGVAPRDEDLDQPFWQDVGDLVAQVRTMPGLSLSLADGFVLALARREACELVTADHGEFDPLLPLNLAAVKFIR